MEKLAVVILTAGEGIRMKSSLPKVLHPVCGRPMIEYVLNTVQNLKPEQTVVVIGKDAERMRTALGSAVKTVVQPKKRGTGDAVRFTESLLGQFKGVILVLCGDTPLLSQATLERLIQTHLKKKATATLLSARLTDPTGYGRVIRDSSGQVEKIVEEKDATLEEREVSEINAGSYCFQPDALFKALQKISPENNQKEYYLTDVIGILRQTGETVAVYCTADEGEILGVNTREDLALASQLVRKRINRYWMNEGVTLVDPQSIFIDDTVTIGPDTVVNPYTFLEGKTVIGRDCRLGPFARLIDSQLSDQCEVSNAVLKEAVLEEGAVVGPYSYLRPGAQVGKKARVGAFVEIKKSRIGEASKVPHLSYIGDTIIGKDVNVGAGTITCNYDGRKKHQTVIEDEAFIGSDTMLIAPVKIGKRAVTGAGSAITKDVPVESLALERSEQKIIKDWNKEKRQTRKEKKTGRQKK